MMLKFRHRRAGSIGSLFHPSRILARLAAGIVGLAGVAGVAGLASTIALATDDPTVVLETTMGDIVIELYPDRAPVSVENFLNHVDGGHYNGAHFYRVVRPDNDNGTPKIRVIQGGMDGTGQPPPFQSIVHESTEQTGITHEDGTISLARGDVGTASSEFFITIGTQPALDAGGTRNPDGHGFAAFGRVVDGMDVVRGINAIDATAKVANPYVENQILSMPVVIRRAYRQ